MLIVYLKFRNMKETFIINKKDIKYIHYEEGFDEIVLKFDKKEIKGFFIHAEAFEKFQDDFLNEGDCYLTIYESHIEVCEILKEREEYLSKDTEI